MCGGVGNIEKMGKTLKWKQREEREKEGRMEEGQKEARKEK